MTSEESPNVRMSAAAHINIYAGGVYVYGQKVALEVTPQLLDAVRQLYPAFEHAYAASKRTPEEWVERLKAETSDTFLLSWAASIIWFHYDGIKATALYDLMETLDVTLMGEDRTGLDDLLAVVGFPENKDIDSDWRNKLRIARSKVRTALANPKVVAS